MNILFLILGFVLAALIFMRNKEIKKNIYKVPENALHITNVDKDGVIKLTGVGKNSEELTLKVIAKHLYQEGDFYWYELECDKGDDDKVWIDVEDDDETNVSIVLEKLSISDFSPNIKNILAHHDDVETGTIGYKGRNFNYVESDSAIFYRFCEKNKPEKLYYWDYRSTNLSLSFEKWGENEYQVFLCQNMKPSQVTVLSNGGDKR